MFDYLTIQNYRKIIFTCARGIPYFSELFTSVAKKIIFNIYLNKIFRGGGRLMMDPRPLNK